MVQNLGLMDPKAIGLEGIVTDWRDFQKHDIPGAVEGDPNKLELETKWIIPSHHPLSVFKSIHTSFADTAFHPDLEIGSSNNIKNTVFLTSSVVNARHTLLSSALDTVDESGRPHLILRLKHKKICV